MSTTEIAEPTAILCPGCGGKIEAAQTICDACRSAMEEQVMAVRAADYPRLFQNAAEDPAETARNPIDPARMDMLKIADQTDDLDLVPLAPIDEPRKGAGEAETTATTSSANTAAVSSAMAVAAPMANYPVAAMAAGQVNRPSQGVHSYASASKLEPTSRWKHVIIAVACVAAAAILAMVLWSVLVPHRGLDANSDTGDQDSAAAPKAASKR